MKVGDLIKIHSSRRRCGDKAGKVGLLVGFDEWGHPIINVDGKICAMHTTQVGEVLNASR